ncbi:phospho-N-acetylmuramoyl-pentapeptide-transferase [Clostridium fallax]|uniref:Phospho-N-acetylmuramoyl-pentapeptide-transferase n=1 Tax=Clostridium fallax TaxID=1533 RepID=A0A1M4YJ94_9CLOT|nr:phospho-N-acetylmuramoyl-pentapeptide-transferase [Clostridium fallax]SHF05807.1 Phospho-N-acetylmuramoyl-pentapeptide-transferase [Clostridium fallax]SQB06302.1 phospho-N-acetylmuramoyl-pentapeptide-transferase [Clostridium fallax]
MNSLSINTILITIFISLLSTAILGPIIIPLLHKLKFGQNIREDGPKSHLKKSGTPTIGGLIFIFATIITMLIVLPYFQNVRDLKDEAMVALYSFIAFGFIGFLDDILKIIHKKNLGLRAWQKMILILIVSLAIAYYGKVYLGTDIDIPFTNIAINFGKFYMIFIVFYFAGTTNAVNLTDGLDGLATSITVLVMTFFAIVSINMSHYSLAVFCIALVAALLGFLRFNAFPARVFMGDTGSLALGGAVAAVAMMLRLEVMVAIVGIIYVIETLSVIIQVTSFKLTGKRVFKMAPIHHHFEQLGFKETKIVTIFSVITVIFCIIGFISL